MRRRPLLPQEVLHIQSLSRQEGMTMFRVMRLYPEVRQDAIRAVWKKGRQDFTWLPTDQEIEERKAEVTAGWTPEQWGNRWVGRYSGVEGGDLQRAASRLMPH